MAEKNQKPPKKIINVALQGGGSHGAYTWGVLDALLADGRISIEGLSGTSAGGLNATAVAQGLVQNGNQGARDMLRKLWERIGEEGKKSPIQIMPWDKATRNYSISKNPLFMMMRYMTTVMSPYQMNPNNNNPLRPIVEELFDFEPLQQSKLVKLFLCATHLATGKLKIFSGQQLSIDALLASACVPTLFQAVEVNGEFFWDGGYIGNPALFPLIYGCESPDLLVIQVHRVHDDKVPTSVHEIKNRLSEISQNACLTREMRAIAFVTDLIDKGIIAPGALKRLYMHQIRDDDFFGTLERDIGYIADPDFLEFMYDAGFKIGTKWLKENFDAIGVRTTANIEADYLS